MNGLKTDFRTLVLIVAKCIVNLKKATANAKATEVLIVAKCIVNRKKGVKMAKKEKVLIVAKCIVNTGRERNKTISFKY